MDKVTAKIAQALPTHLKAGGAEEGRHHGKSQSHVVSSRLFFVAFAVSFSTLDMAAFCFNWFIFMLPFEELDDRVRGDSARSPFSENSYQHRTRLYTYRSGR